MRNRLYRTTENVGKTNSEPVKIESNNQGEGNPHLDIKTLEIT